MLVSIIIPVYNVAPYVEQCIRSVMSQTMTEGVECIIVDDCGQDNSMKIVERIVSVYEGELNFQILHHDYNKGLSVARNTGIEAATGEFLYFLDSDDWIVPNCLEVLFAMTKKYSSVQLVQGGIICEKYFIGFETSKSSVPEYVKGDGVKEIFLNPLYIPGTSWNKLISSRLIKENNILFAENRLHEDDLWKFMLSKCLKSMCVCKQETYNYFIREDGLASSSIKKSEDATISNIKDCILSLNRDNNNAQIKYILYLVFSVWNTKKNRSTLMPWLGKLFLLANGTMQFYLLLFLIIPQRLQNRIRIRNSILDKISFVI